MKQEKDSLFSEKNDFDHGEMMRAVTVLLERYPFLDLRYLGTSVLGRTIPLLTLGNGEREVLYVATHHGMEWITSLVLCRFLRDLCEAVNRNTKVCHTSPSLLFQTHTLYFVPMLNPDGVEYQIHGVTKDNPLYERVLKMNGESEDFSSWQANARGVDLNHNYDAGFEEYQRMQAEIGIRNGAPTKYSGESPESEPEVAALCNFIRFHSRLRGILTLHTQGEEIYYQSGQCTPKGTYGIAKTLSAYTGYKVSLATGTAAYGGLTDWCVQKLSLPSFTLECGRGKNPLPITDAFPIYATLRKALFAFPTFF